MDYSYRCNFCDIRFQVIKSYRQIDDTEFCEKCGSVAERYFNPGRVQLMGASGPVEKPEYNPALGKWTTSKRHKHKELAEYKARTGSELIEIGNESPEKMFKAEDRDRQRRADARWRQASHELGINSGE